MSDNKVQGVDYEALDAACAINDDPRPPSAAAFDDPTPVTVTVTKGEALHLQTGIRAALEAFISNVRNAERSGYKPTEAQLVDTNSALRGFTSADRKLTEVVGDYEVDQEALDQYNAAMGASDSLEALLASFA